MEPIDILLGAVILVGAAIGLRRGVIRVLLSIVGIYPSLIVIGYGYQPISQALSGAFSMDRVFTDNFAYVVLLIAVTVAVELLSRTVFEETHLRAIGGLDNVLGGLIGLLYGALWASLLLVPVQYDIYATLHTSAWTEAVFASDLIPRLNDIFQTGVINIVGIFFSRPMPYLFRNPVYDQLAQFFFNLIGWV